MKFVQYANEHSRGIYLGLSLTRTDTVIDDVIEAEHRTEPVTVNNSCRKINSS